MPKKRFPGPLLPQKPFKLGTTSFIFPDHIIPNVKQLGAFFDEIELLVFESHPAAVLPSKEDVKTLLSLSRDLDLTYNIHLPTDVSLSCGSYEKRQTAADTLLKVIDRFAPLAPTTHTLHLELPQEVKTDMKNQKKVKNWEKATQEHLGSFVSGLSSSGIISIETLDYPFFLIESLVEDLNLSVCIDAGHQVKYGHNLADTFEANKSRTPIIHLHGVAFSSQAITDHTALDKLPESHWLQFQTILEQFTGVVSLEVFNLENLNRSLAFLAKRFQDVPLPILRKTMT